MTMDRQALLQLMEETADLVASLTGIKKQFMDAGWSEQAAEMMVHAMYVRPSNRQA